MTYTCFSIISHHPIHSHHSRSLRNTKCYRRRRTVIGLELSETAVWSQDGHLPSLHPALAALKGGMIGVIGPSSQ